MQVTVFALGGRNCFLQTLALLPALHYRGWKNHISKLLHLSSRRSHIWPFLANIMQGRVSWGSWKDYFFPHMQEILKERPSAKHHSCEVAILWDTRCRTRAWQRHQMGSEILETLNHCQRPQMSRSLVMWDIARRVFCYLKLKAFLTSPKNEGHTLGQKCIFSSEFHRDFSLTV